MLGFAPDGSTVFAIERDIKHAGAKLLQQLGLQLSRRQTRISTRRAQAKECKQLEITLHAPLLCVRTLNTQPDGQVAEYSVSLTRGDMIELTLEHQ